MHNQRAVHTQPESSTCTIRKQYVYKQRVVHVQYIVQPESSTFTIHCTTREQYMYNTLYNQRAVHVQSESSTCTTQEESMYKQRSVHCTVQPESSKCTITEQYMYNQREVQVQSVSIKYTTREQYIYSTTREQYIYNQRAVHICTTREKHLSAFTFEEHEKDRV
jgi:hypothetical protein